MELKFILIIILSTLNIQVWTQLNPNIFKGNKISYKSNNNKIRKTSDNNNYEPIRIFSDYSYIKYQSKDNSILSTIEKEIEKAMDDAVKIVQKLISLNPLTYNINKITSEDLTQWGFKSNNIENKLLSEGKGIQTDLLILLKFIETGEENLLLDNDIASFSTKFILDEETKRPIIGTIYINNNININIANFDLYLKTIFLHEITHILGFYYDLFQYYPGGLEKTIVTEIEERTKVEKKFIITPKVVEFAKKYFNCTELRGVELENQHDLPWSHWEARILLGEYMTSSPYTPEQVISEFTLSLLEDSGWYKVNYYTGGLMRFGKSKGCEFLNKDCMDTTRKPNFNYEFCDFSQGVQPTCSSGRQSRTYCESYPMIQIDKKYMIYKRFGSFIGRMNADYCFVNDIDKEEEKDIYYVGNCKYGNGKYGTHNNFGNEELSNGNFENILGEKYGPNSFCALSSIIPKEKSDVFNSYVNSARALCYPMFCSSKSLSIQIFDQYIVCPREGGKVEVSGKYQGYILCPDYNLICTGTTLCNDMFDCVEKESLLKENTFDYDYEINTDEDKIYKAEELAELGEDGLCPKNCVECNSDKKCLKCLDKYTFISESKLGSVFNCIKEEEIDKKKYCLNDKGYYYNCEWQIKESTLDEKIKEEILEGKLDKIIDDYINKNELVDNLIMSYKNGNLSVIIYKGKGNKDLLESIISSDTEKEILDILNENYQNGNNKIKAIIKDNEKNYISIYDENGNEINIKEECPECTNIKINIKNNYENILNKKFGEAIKNVILNNKIDIFDDEAPVFNDICSNFTVSGIDIPLDSRKNIFYLGENKSEIICGNSNCEIIKDNYNTNQLEGECKCDFNIDLNNIKSNKDNEVIKQEMKLKEVSSSEEVKNTFQIFKCFKGGKFLKVNEGFYITVISFGIQSVCFALYLIFTPKMPLVPSISVANPIRKNNQEKNAKTDNNDNDTFKSEESGDILNEKTESQQNQRPNNSRNNDKIENNIINYGNIDEDIIDDDKFSNNNVGGGIVNTNYHYRETNELKLDTIKIENKANFKLSRNDSQKSLNEDTKIFNEKNKKMEDDSNTNTHNVNTNAQLYITTTGDFNNKPKETVDFEQYSLHGSVNKKLNVKEKDEKEFEEKLKSKKKITIIFGDKNKINRNIKDTKNYENENSEKNNIDIYQNHNYEKSNEIPLDYLPIEKAIQLDKRSFGLLYWSIFSFKQPIVNIFSFLDFLQITKSCIPLQMKLIRFLLMVILNIFINAMTITQNYFKEKYEYFNKKYDIDGSNNMKLKIDPIERLSYAMKHCFPEAIITFIICMIVQFIINFIFFGIRRELCLISINEKKENISKEVQKLVKKTKVRYIIFAFVNLVFMIIFFVYLTNFSMAYQGGALDYIGAGMWTFIFSQILPFISSIIISCLRHYGMKNKNEGMYKMSQVLLA